MMVSFASSASSAPAKVERPLHVTRAPAALAELRRFSGASSLIAVFSYRGALARFQQLLESHHRADLEVVALAVDGVQAQRLQVHDLHRLAVSPREESPAAERKDVWLREQVQGFIEGRRAVIDGDHLLSVSMGRLAQIIPALSVPRLARVLQMHTPSTPHDTRSTSPK